MVSEKILESPLDCKEIQPVSPKRDQSWIFIGITDAEVETLILWPPDVKNWLPGKDPDAGKDWKWEEKGDGRGWDAWLASLTRWTWIWASSGSWWWTGKPAVHEVAKSWTRLSDWTELIHVICVSIYPSIYVSIDPSIYVSHRAKQLVAFNVYSGI